MTLIFKPLAEGIPNLQFTNDGRIAVRECHDETSLFFLSTPWDWATAKPMDLVEQSAVEDKLVTVHGVWHRTVVLTLPIYDMLKRERAFSDDRAIFNLVYQRDHYKKWCYRLAWAMLLQAILTLVLLTQVR